MQPLEVKTTNDRHKIRAATAMDLIDMSGVNKQKKADGHGQKQAFTPA